MTPFPTEELRAAALHAEHAYREAHRGDADLALELWSGLLEGRWTFVDRYERDGRRYLVASQNEPEAARERALTMREAQALTLAARGVPLKRIASALEITVGAASAYLTNAQKKTGIHSRREFVRWFAAVVGDDDR